MIFTKVSTLVLASIATGPAAVMLMGQKMRERKALLTCSCSAYLDNKTVVISGATSGIGKEVAYQCAMRNAKVIIGARDVYKGAKVKEELKSRTKNGKIFVVPLDLEDLQSCKEFSRKVLRISPKITFLVNNAAEFPKYPRLTRDGFDKSWQTNYLGHIVVTENLFNHITPEPQGNHGVIFMSSESTKDSSIEDIRNVSQMKTVPTLNTTEEATIYYGKTKLATLLYSSYLALKQKKNPPVAVPVVSVDPGHVWSGMMKKYYSGVPYLMHRTYYYFGMGNQKEGAQTVIHCMLGKNIKNGHTYRENSSQGLVKEATVTKSVSFIEDSRSLISRFLPKSAPSVERN